MTQCSLTGVAALFDAGKTLQWDPARHLFTNGTASNAMLRQPRVGQW